MAVVPLWSSSSTIRETQKWGNSCNIPSVLGNEGGNESTKRASPKELELTHTPIFSTQQVAKLSESIEINTQECHNPHSLPCCPQ